jgi:4-amino-4-deoxy-L-arabinose transferase-like glycosyltransferase
MSDETLKSEQAGDAPGAAAAAEPALVEEPPEAPTAPTRRSRAALRTGGDHEPPASSTGNPLRRVRGTMVMLAGALVPFFFMSSDRRWSISVALGTAGCAISVLGMLDLLGTFDDPEDKVVARPERDRLTPRLAEIVASGAALYLALRLAVAGVLPLPIASAALLVTGSFLWLVVSVFRAGRELGAWQKDELGQDRPLLQRHGFWLVSLTTLLYLPLLGSYSLSDPWETHYGEVAREMIARDDWISLWWAQDGWFWSKPVADFWMQALFFKALGVQVMPDQMLAGVAHGRFPQPEWAARMPVFLLTVLGVYFLYKGVSRVYGRRAGLYGGIVLLTMPYWYLIAHQTMTDMPYVGPLAAAMGLFLLAFHTDPEVETGRYELVLGPLKLRLGLHHLVLGAVALIVVPQVLYLASRNLTLQLDATPHGFRAHFDAFWSGSGGGNCGLPGNEDCRRFAPVNKQLQPWMAAALWALVGGTFLWLNRGERRLQRLYFIAAWFFVALSALAKGAPGLVLPLFILGAYVGATRRWQDLTRVELASMVLVVACVTLPWYVQMYMRHGQPFTDRLLFHDMYKRAFVHVHDTNAGDDVSFRYYIWQLGYGLFPWTGLAAGGLVWWLRRANDRLDSRGDGGAFLALWFVTAFSMFTITLTKFHHYVLPVVPPTAMLVGVMLDRAIRTEELPTGRRLAAYIAGLTGSVMLVVYGFLRLFPGSVLGRTTDGKQPLGALPWLGYGSIALGVLLAVVVVRVLGQQHEPAAASSDRSSAQPELGAGQLMVDSSEPALASASLPLPAAALPAVIARSYDRVLLGVIGLAAAIVLVVVGRDMIVTNPGDVEGQARLMHLFTYNYRRPWPESLQFGAVFKAFTIVPAVLCALLVVRRWRTHVAVMLLAAAAVWAAWGLDVYLVKAAPHWGQRETVLAYYRDRQGPEEPLVAYQMNWKGENFYAGNRVPAFVASGQKFKDWIEEQKKQGVTTFYFTTEHGREGSLKSELGNPADFSKLTSSDLNNKFFLGRARF